MRRGRRHPKARIIFDPIARHFVNPTDIDLSDQKEEVTIIGVEDPAKWCVSPEAYMEHSKI
jgi:hypothetical protein